METVESPQPVILNAKVPGSEHEVPVAFTPPQWTQKALAEFPKVALHIDESVTAADNEAFEHYFNRFSSDATLVSAYRTRNMVVANLDYHEDSKTPALDLHSLTRVYRKDRKYSAWEQKNSRKLTQVEFVEFLEDHLQDVIDPSQSSLLNSVTQFKANRSSSFSSVIEGPSGDSQFTFAQKTDGGSFGTAVLPERITIQVPIFEFEAEYLLTARLRYKVDDEKRLSFTFEFIQLEDAIDIAFRGAVLSLARTVGEKIILVD